MPTIACPICGGQHRYKDCHDPSINTYDSLLLEAFVAHNTNPGHFQTHRDFLVEEVPSAVARALIYQSDEENSNLVRDYRTITGWRNDNTDVYTTISNGQFLQLRIPKRVGVISQANNSDLNSMLFIKYKHEANLALRGSRNPSHPYHHIFRNSIAQRHSRHLQNSFNLVRRELRNPYLTADGLYTYLNSVRSQINLTMTQLETNDSNVITENIPFLPSFASPETAPMIHNILTTSDPEASNASNPARYEIRNRIAAYLDNITHDSTEMQYHSMLGSLRRQNNTPPSPPPAPRRPVSVRTPRFEVDLECDETRPFPPDLTCTICWDPINAQNGCTTDCNHGFCNDCMIAHIRTTRATKIRQLRNSRSSSSSATRTDICCPMCRHNVRSLHHYSLSEDATNKILEMRLMLFTAPTTPPPPFPLNQPIAPHTPTTGPTGNTSPIGVNAPTTPLEAPTIATEYVQLLNELNGAPSWSQDTP